MTYTIAFLVDSVPMTKAVIEGQTSLGGSESACLGLARALAARGHAVHIIARHLAPDAPAIDAAGVHWHPDHALADLNRWMDWDVVVALRQPGWFGPGLPASLRILWCQDMLAGEAAKAGVMATAWAYDGVAYVSRYQQHQWETLAPELAGLGYVTRNGFDPALVPTDVAKVPGRVIYCSRPERGLAPLLAMWPALKSRVPHAELQVCRYASMYDGEGSQVRAMCEHFDRQLAAVQAEVGGITWLGQLGKADLYRAIAAAQVMWYPGVVDFAETSCIAAIEAQACGTPFVGSYKGALPETAPYATLLPGDAMAAEYQRQSVNAVVAILEQGPDAFALAKARQHVQAYTYDAIAAEWEGWCDRQIDARVEASLPAILDQLLHEDDLVAARVVAEDLGDAETVALCDRVKAGLEQTSEDYAAHAMDPAVERQTNPRIDAVVAQLVGCRRVLDVACGNGAMAVAFAEADPDRALVGVDYAAGNIDVARAFAATRGVETRTAFAALTVWDYATQALTPEAEAFLQQQDPFDAIVLGEFCEHVWDVQGLLTSLHRYLAPGGRIICTVPAGPFVELLPRGMPLKRGHVHHFRRRDLQAIFSAQDALHLEYLDMGITRAGSGIGHWIIRYQPSGAPLGDRPLAERILMTRPRTRLSAGLIVRDATLDLPKCLEHIYGVVDEIVIGDCGSADPEGLAAIATAYGARVLPLQPVEGFREGFAGARNAVLAATTGDWFLWLDADEWMVGAAGLRRYVEGNRVYRGFALYQRHLHLDVPNHFDQPVRLFKRGDDIQFYGCIHEQPQQGDCNGDIWPVLQIGDVPLAHTGYLHEGIRRQKAIQRNMPLLVRDQEVFPDRVLGKLLVMRDFCNLAMWEQEREGGRQTPTSKRYWANVVGYYETYFADPAHKLHAVARPFYDQALASGVAGAFEVEVAVAAMPHGLGGQHPRPVRFWARKIEDVRRELDHRMAEALKPHAPIVLDVEPWRGAAPAETEAETEAVPV